MFFWLSQHYSYKSFPLERNLNSRGGSTIELFEILTLLYCATSQSCVVTNTHRAVRHPFNCEPMQIDLSNPIAH